MATTKRKAYNDTAAEDVARIVHEVADWPTSTETIGVARWDEMDAFIMAARNLKSQVQR